jgi:hypothetical protein
MGFSTDGPLVRISKGIGYATAFITLLFGISRIWDSTSGYYARKAQVRQLLAESEVQRAGSDYRAAWDTLGKAAAIQSSADVVHAEEDVAMEWLRKIRIQEGQTFTAIVNLVAPVLTHGVIQSSGTRKADLLAHLGWGDYLRFRENQRELHPDSYFDDALKTDSSNVYAHTFKGFWIIWNRGPLNEASAQFRSALDSKRERAMVREIQFAALFNSAGLEESDELLRVCAEMVRNSETVPSVYRDKVFTDVYWFSRQDAEIRERFLKVLDIQDHLKMYQALYGPSFDTSTSLSREFVRDFWMATLLERAGHTSEAIPIYRKVKSRFDQESKTNSMYPENYIQATKDAIRRLSASR